MAASAVKTLEAANRHIDEVKRERDEFRQELGKLRLQYATLQAEFEELRSELVDLKRDVREKEERRKVSSQPTQPEPLASLSYPPPSYYPPPPRSPQRSELNEMGIFSGPSSARHAPNSGKRAQASQPDGGPPNKLARTERRTSFASGHTSLPSARHAANVSDPGIIILGDMALSRLLDGVNAISVNSYPVSASREQLCSCYGVSPHHAISDITPSKNRGIKKLRTFFLPQASSHPYLPTSPGHSGVIFFDSELSSLKNVTLFTPQNDGSWLMMGEYRLEIGGYLSGHEFCQQSNQTQQFWAGQIMAGPTYQLGRLRDKLLEKCGKGSPNELTEGEVIEALMVGAVTIPIIRVRCIGYDNSLAEDIAQGGHQRQPPRGPRR